MICSKCGKEIDDGLEICAKCTAEIKLEETKKKAEGFVKEEKKNYTNFKNLSFKQKLIRVAVPVLAVIILISAFSGGGTASVESDSRNDCYYFDIKYNEFCKEMADAISEVSGVSKSDIKKSCKTLNPYEDSCEYCGNDVLKYEIEAEWGRYTSALGIDVYVDPKTDRVIYVEVIKANGASSRANFRIITDRASEVLCGKKITKLGSHITDTKTDGDKSITDIEYKDYKLNLIEGGGYTMGDYRKLRISCLDADNKNN